MLSQGTATAHPATDRPRAPAVPAEAPGRSEILADYRLCGVQVLVRAPRGWGHRGGWGHRRHELQPCRHLFHAMEVDGAGNAPCGHSAVLSRPAESEAEIKAGIRHWDVRRRWERQVENGLWRLPIPVLSALSQAEMAVPARVTTAAGMAYRGLCLALGRQAVHWLRETTAEILAAIQPHGETEELEPDVEIYDEEEETP